MQEELEKLFPSWNSIEAHKEVLKFAIGESNNSDTLVEVICQTMISESRINYFHNGHVDLLKSLGNEMKENSKMDMLHNKNLNYLTNTNPVVFVPSRFFVFQVFNNKIPEKDEIEFQNDNPVSADYSPAECVMDPTGNDHLSNILDLVIKINERQQLEFSKVLAVGLILDSSLVREEYEARVKELERKVNSFFKLSKKLGSFALTSCHLSEDVFRHVAQEMNGLRYLKNLSLVNIVGQVPKQLVESIRTMDSLKRVSLQSLYMSRPVRHEIIKALSCCKNIVNLSLRDIELTNCAAVLFQEGFSFLENLYLSKTKLNRRDLSAIAQAVTENKLHQMKTINLSENNLDGSVKLLTHVKGQAITFPELEELHLKDCNLGQDDITTIAQAVRGNKLPKLNKLNIGSNMIKNSMKNLFGETRHLAFSSIEELNLTSTDLSATDLKILSEALSHMTNCKILNLSNNKLTGITSQLFVSRGLLFVQDLNLEHTNIRKNDITDIDNAIKCGKLPVLHKLRLEGNTLSDKENDVKELFQTCISYFKQGSINIEVTLDDLLDSDKFAEEVKCICQGTTVSCSWSRSPWIVWARRYQAWVENNEKKKTFSECQVKYKSYQRV